ncbi:MAG: hypothetical protein MUP02_10325 [Actinobacteria bacterium]|nr:hypothetical protein [Actinomycetota bacterium]
MIKRRIKLKKTITVLLTLVIFITFLFLATGCVCPLFSMLERFTGLQISTGKNIDSSAIEDELIYPGSIALVQINGDIERILELIGDYGVSLSGDELEVLEQLPDSIKGQEVGVTVYSTPDDKTDVTGYYFSLGNRGWEINDFGDVGGNLEGNSMLAAEKNERKQALMIAGTENNSFIIFIDFDWDMLDNEKW